MSGRRMGERISVVVRSRVLDGMERTTLGASEVEVVK